MSAAKPAAPKPDPRFTYENGVLKGTLTHGFKVGDKAHRDFEMRELSVGDMLDAEVDATGELSFKANLLTLQITRVGDFGGAISVGMLRKLKPSDFAMLRDAQNQVQILGEAGAAPGAAD